MPMNKQRTIANVRERKRTQLLNQAYKQLQSIIPKEPSDKMSKIHTLKLALSYIHFLNDILKTSDNNPASNESTSEPTSLNGLDNRQYLDQSPAYARSCSPTCSTGFSHHLYSPASEEENEYQPSAKRARFESGQSNPIPTDQYQSDHHYNNPYHDHHENSTTDMNLLQQSPITTHTEHYNKLESNQNTPSAQVSYVGDPGQYYPTSSSVSSYYSEQMTSPSDAITSTLRNAFREYRSMKRKIRA